MNNDQCEHNFIYIDSIYDRIIENFNCIYKRIDRFYCLKCPEEKETIKSEQSRGKPDWFKE
jgi:hypothetical protein